MAISAPLNQFISELKNSGFPTASRFYVIIGGPQTPGEDNNSVMMLCDSATVPGFNHMTTEMRRYGEIIEMPYGITYPAVNLTFYVDNTLRAKTFFDVWSEKVFNKVSRDVGFYSDFVRNIDMYMQNANDEVIYSVKLHQAYPKSIGNFEMAFGNRDILRVQAQITYKWHEVFPVEANGDPYKLTPRPVVGSLRALEKDVINLSSKSASNEAFGSFTGIAGGTDAILSPVFGGSVFSLSQAGGNLVTQVPRAARSVVTATNAFPGAPVGMGSTVGTLGSQIASIGSQIQSISRIPASIVTGSSIMGGSANGLASTVMSLSGLVNAGGVSGAGLISSAAGITRSAQALSSANTPAKAAAAMQGLGQTMGVLGSQVTQISNSPGPTIGFNPPMLKAFSSFGSTISSTASSMANSFTGFIS